MTNIYKSILNDDEALINAGGVAIARELSDSLDEALEIIKALVSKDDIVTEKNPWGAGRVCRYCEQINRHTRDCPVHRGKELLDVS